MNQFKFGVLVTAFLAIQKLSGATLLTEKELKATKGSACKFCVQLSPCPDTDCTYLGLDNAEHVYDKIIALHEDFFKCKVVPELGESDCQNTTPIQCSRREVYASFDKDDKCSGAIRDTTPVGNITCD